MGYVLFGLLFVGAVLSVGIGSFAPIVLALIAVGLVDLARGPRYAKWD